MRRLLLLLVASALLACGAEAEEGKSEALDPVVDVLISCRTFAARLCSSAAPCCSATNSAFEPEACEDAVVAEVCRPAADAVTAGFATYHPEQEEACLEAHASSHEACLADWSELVALRRSIWSACKVVRGTAAPGASCTTPVTCAQPEGASVARCSAGRCRVLELLGEGAECPYPNGDVSVCDEGLYCTSSERDEAGVCAPVTPLDAPCNPVPLNPECGLGRYCDLELGVCRLATNFGGAHCEQGPECVSFSCDRVSNECAPPLPTVAELCPAML